MGPAGLLGLLLWTHTVLAAIVSSEGSPQLTNGGVVRQKRQHTTNDTIEEILLRITDVEENVTRTESAVENISEHLAALGFHLSPTETDVQRSKNPCEKYSQEDLEGQNEIPWTLWEDSKCVKLLSGLSTFSNAKVRCRQQHTKGQDIGYPDVVSLDSSSNVTSLVGLLRQRLKGNFVWVGLRPPSALLNCIEMKVPKSSEAQVYWNQVDCGKLSRVVCEKPLPLSFAELAEGHWETKRRVEELETENRARKEDMEELRQSFRTLRDSLRSGQGVLDPDSTGVPSTANSEAEDQFQCHVSQERKERLELLEGENLLLENQVALLEGNFTLGEEELRREVELLKGQLGKQLTSTMEEKTLRAEETRQLLINLETATSVEVSKVKESSRTCRVAAETEGAEAKRRLEDVEGTLRRLEATLDRKTSAWELGGQTAFKVSKSMGDWHWIELFGNANLYTPSPCVEFILNLRGLTVESTHRWRESGKWADSKANYTVDTQDPHQWMSEGWSTWTWVKMDYANWAVLMTCGNKELSSCGSLFILSRERTLPPATLEMLRNVAEQRGFPRADGELVDQTSC